MPFDLASLGWDADFSAAYARFAGPGHTPGRVIRVDRGACTLLTSTGTARASLGGGVLAAAARSPERLPCAGDWAVVRAWPDRRVTLEAVLPRRTAVIRAGTGEQSTAQVLAANLDTVAVVEPVDPSPDSGRVERLLALAWESGAVPVVLLTKTDLAADPVALADQIAEIAPGVPVYPVSVTAGTGLDRVRALVGRGRTLGLLGPSGAGKSSLVNALARATVMGTQARRADGRGRHTTTHRALVPLPDGGAVIDTPGLRAVGLLDTGTGLDRAFADVTALVARCRFGDCRHQAEPGCAVRDALETGELPRRRYDSWRRLHHEMTYHLSRHTARLAGDHRTHRYQPKSARRRDARP